MTTQRYNPFQAALAELTGNDARIFYARTAWWAAQHAVDDTIVTISYTCWAIAAFGQLAWDCGVQFRAQVDEGYHANDPELVEGELLEEMPLEPEAEPEVRLLLPQIQLPTPAGVPTLAPMLPELSLSTTDSSETIDDHMAMTKRQLQRLCRQRGIDYKSNERKSILVKRLSAWEESVA